MAESKISLGKQTMFNAPIVSTGTTDLNDFKSVGSRFVDLSTMSNGPRSTGMGMLYIIPRGDNNQRVFHLLFIYEVGVCYAYIRSQSGNNEFTPWKELSSPKIESATLLTSGYTANITKANDDNWVMRSGNVATLRLNIKGVNVSSGNFSSGVLIPEGYRPRFNISFIAGDGSATGQTVGTITSAGTLSSVYFGSTGYLQGTFTYICY